MVLEQEAEATFLGEESGTECLCALDVTLFSPDPTIAECTGNVNIVSNVNPSAEPYRLHRLPNEQSKQPLLHL